MWGYIIGTLRKPMTENDEKYEEQLDICEVSNLKIIIGIDNSVDNSMDIQLAKYETTKWDL